MSVGATDDDHATWFGGISRQEAAPLVWPADLLTVWLLP
jgi:hypothetical protein